jgi:hypothetical protein
MLLAIAVPSIFVAAMTVDVPENERRESNDLGKVLEAGKSTTRPAKCCREFPRRGEVKDGKM